MYSFRVSDGLMRMMQHCSSSSCACIAWNMRQGPWPSCGRFKCKQQPLSTLNAFQPWVEADPHWFHSFASQLRYLARLDAKRHYMAIYAWLLSRMKSLRYETDDASVGCLGQWSNLFSHMESNREDTMARVWIRKVHSGVSIYVLGTNIEVRHKKCVITEKWWQDPD